MNPGAQLPQSRRELRATILQMDLADGFYKSLAGFGGRLMDLLGNARIISDENAKGALDDLLGAVYSLMLARHHDFEDRTDRTIEIEAVRKRAEQILRGDVRIDGKWIAGWHFNSALFRVAAVYHRLLKIVSGHPGTKEYVPTLLAKVEPLYLEWMKTDWSSTHVHAIHDEVNTLKHRPKGVYSSRIATFEDAITGVDELLKLVEAWSNHLY